jgi:hypothetical protein
MSKATDSAEASSAPTAESSETTDTSVDPQGEARALTVRTEGNRDPLYGTDRALARSLIEEAERHRNTDIRDVKIQRYGETVDVRLTGDVVLSYSDLGRVADDTYAPHDVLSHASGAVTATMSTR